jgi:hypothetical protein
MNPILKEVSMLSLVAVHHNDRVVDIMNPILKEVSILSLVAVHLKWPLGITMMRVRLH